VVGSGEGDVRSAVVKDEVRGRTPLRDPDTSSRAVMTRRAWWLLGIGLLIPGSAQVLAGSRRLGRIGVAATLLLWAAVVVLLLALLVVPSLVFSVAALDGTLAVLQVVLVACAALWLVLTLDTLRLTRLVKLRPRARVALGVATALALLVSVGTAGYGGHLVGISRGLLSTVFGDGPVAAPVDGRYNVLLLGGDAGEDRAGLRPDSISVASIDTTTGAATVIGLPRNLRNVPFPEDSPMHDLYPDGYLWRGCNVDPCMLNSIHTEVELKSPELYPDAVADGSSPGIEATRDAVEGALGLPIQYYAFVDMQGFASLIDALGGIDVDYTGDGDLPFGGVLDETTGELVGVNAWLTPGEHHLDGSNALAYARSRYGSAGGDYDRMVRQREVQGAILARLSPVNVLLQFQGIADAGARVVRTDIPQGALGGFLQLALRTRSQPIGSVELTPPAVDPEHPDYDAIHASVAEALTGG
jgi:LCP family protein required for cell wall assembly